MKEEGSLKKLPDIITFRKIKYFKWFGDTSNTHIKNEIFPEN